jgi:hypothetical protein
MGWTILDKIDEKQTSGCENNFSSCIVGKNAKKVTKNGRNEYRGILIFT